MSTIPGHIPPREPNKNIEAKGDVSRDLLEALDLATTFVAPRDLKKANKENGINRLKEVPKKDHYKGYFKETAVIHLQSAGDTHLAALRVFRKQTMTSGYSGDRQTQHIHHHKHKPNGGG